MDLSTPVQKIPRVGPAFLKKLQRLGVKNIGQLLYHFPHRYEDFSNLIPVSQAQIGGPFCFQGQITDIKNIRTFRKRMMITQAALEDESGKLKATWFNQPYLINTLKKGTFVCLAGKISGQGKSIYLSNPAYEKLPSSAELSASEGKPENFTNNDLTHTGRLIPVYPETEGLSSKWLRFIIKPLLLKLKDLIPDPLPPKIIKKYDFPSLSKALWQIHFPDYLKTAQEAKKRFGFEELFGLSLFVLREKWKLAKEKAIPVSLDVNLMKEFTDSLPYELTDAQKKSSWQILKDLEKPRPMNRLLEGDVGSGKTVVAAMAALNSAKAGYQTAILAPTEILAKQHFKTMKEVLKNFRISIGLMTGKESYFGNKKLKRAQLIEKVKNKKIDILIGTHAIIQDATPRTVKQTPLQFNNLALVIIDEQHRFGVEQRAKLCQPARNASHSDAGGSARNASHSDAGGQKNFIPHLLSMTATPIPRTLSLTLYGDLDLSLIDESPKGRKKIITKIIQPKDKKATYEFIRKQIKEGRQAFVICPRIEPKKVSEGMSEEQLSLRALSWMDVKAVKEEYKKLSEEIFPDLRLAMLHGKMKSEEKERIMLDFKNKKTDILVSTSVVEVGIDVPNATVIVIEGSEKFGLAQLHQFRGRVGRSNFQSYCFLFTETPGTIYNRRLRALLTCDNGFELAEKDLSIRGPGDFIGQRQWGIPDLTMASLSDTFLIPKARNEAKEILQEDPELKKYPLLKMKLEEFQNRVHLE